MVYGPDGNLYVSSMFGNSVLRYDATGAPLPAPSKPGAEFVSPGAGGLQTTRSLAFGPDGQVYVVSQDTDAVLRFNAATGEPAGISGQPGDAVFIAPGSGGLDQPRGLLFHTDGYLYVTSVGGTSPAAGMDSILRYSAATGAPAGISGQSGDAVFVASGSGGLDNPSQIVFQNGVFYVASTSPSTSNSVLKYSTAGSFLGAFVSQGSGGTASSGLSGPADIAFRDGYLYVASWTNNKVLRYSGATGSFVDVVASGGGLYTPLGLLFEPDGDLLVTSRESGEIRRYSSAANAVFTVRLSAPLPTPISVDFATADGSATAPIDYLSAAGTLTFEPGQLIKTVVVQAVDNASGENTETFSVNLINASGGNIADGVGVGTIIDNDPGPTKFYVVNDGETDRTYEYGPYASAVENTALSSGNIAPRGVASNPAGDKVWVVDANKKVYVYRTNDNALLGSWTAGGIQQPEGVTTNGTDIWILDSKANRVFKFAGAAIATSGTLKASSNFSLPNGRTAAPAKDLVTDGTHIWVVREPEAYNSFSSTTVLKYSLGGQLIADWWIGDNVRHPTGITLDPANPAHIWVVDNQTLRVYQFSNALNETSGRYSDAVFSLAPGNTNPQGIADPPASSVGGLTDPLSSPSADSAFDSALLSIVGELDGLIGSGKKRK
jgi:sugar lactone lactonase YvrE